MEAVPAKQYITLSSQSSLKRLMAVLIWQVHEIVAWT